LTIAASNVGLPSPAPTYEPSDPPEPARPVSPRIASPEIPYNHCLSSAGTAACRFIRNNKKPAWPPSR
jgi:hypothetical protein